jgi:uncharacterized DUF497 family protein
MKLVWDPRKREANLAKHGVDFPDAEEMFGGPMLLAPDARRDYGEERLIGFGFIRGRLMAVAFACPAAGTVRIISLRKANQRERLNYEKKIADRLGQG